MLHHHRERQDNYGKYGNELIPEPRNLSKKQLALPDRVPFPAASIELACEIFLLRSDLDILDCTETLLAVLEPSLIVNYTAIAPCFHPETGQPLKQDSRADKSHEYR